MEEKEFRAAKARIAYEQYMNSLPKCDKCEEVMFVEGNYGDRRVCTAMRKDIPNRTRSCPLWCPKRK